jgi:hypothetical protein
MHEKYLVDFSFGISVVTLMRGYGLWSAHYTELKRKVDLHYTGGKHANRSVLTGKETRRLLFSCRLPVRAYLRNYGYEEGQENSRTTVQLSPASSSLYSKLRECYEEGQGNSRTNVQLSPAWQPGCSLRLLHNGSKPERSRSHYCLDLQDIRCCDDVPEMTSQASP